MLEQLSERFANTLIRDTKENTEQKNYKLPILEIMLIHFISGSQHCVGVQSYIISLASLKTKIHSGQILQVFMDMTPCILEVILLSGKHTASVFSAYFLTAQNLKMKGV